MLTIMRVTHYIPAYKVLPLEVGRIYLLSKQLLYKSSIYQHMLNTVDTMVYKIQPVLSKTSLSGRGGGQESALLPHIMVVVFVQLLCPTLYVPMDCSPPCFPILHHLPEFAQTQAIDSVMPSNHLVLYYCPECSSHV